MALKVPKGGGPDLFKAGYKYMSGLEEAVLRNIQAVGELTEIVRTSFGPNGEHFYCMIYQNGSDHVKAETN
jgi:T-complex protein 1 subunit theta